MTHATARFAAFAFAATVTLAMLAGIGALADTQAAHATMAAASAPAAQA